MMNCFLLLENCKKSNNWGPTLRCAAANGIRKILVVGYSQCSVDGAHGANKYLRLVPFTTANEAVASFSKEHQSQQLTLVGILGGLPMPDASDCNRLFPVREDDSGLYQVSWEEGVNNSNCNTKTISKNSYPVGQMFSSLNVPENVFCFVICKAKKGLVPSLAKHCDHFVHIPHQSLSGSFEEPALLDGPACLSIVLHHYAEWAGVCERKFERHKFEVNRSEVISHQIEQGKIRRGQRQKQKEEQTQETYWSSAEGFFIDDKNDQADY